jgi:hypothetical protein
MVIVQVGTMSHFSALTGRLEGYWMCFAFRMVLTWPMVRPLHPLFSQSLSTNKSVVTYDVDAGRRDSRSAPQRRQFRIRTNQDRTGQLSWPAWLTQNQRQPTVTSHSPSPRFSACALLWTQHADGGRRLDIPNHSWQALQRYQPPAPASQASREKRRCCKRRALLLKDAQAQLGHSKMSKRRWIERQLTLHRQPTRRDRN